jgi:uncharacterized delta-60 repeat protein
VTRAIAKHRNGEQYGLMHCRAAAVVVLALALAAGAGTALALGGAGALDPLFGSGGTTVLNKTVSTFPTPAATAAGGKFVLVSTANNQITVSRLLANGAPDPSFDADGDAVIVPPVGATAISARDVAVQPDGKIVVVGTVESAGNEDMAVWRLKANGDTGNQPNGALDPTFDGDGFADQDNGGSEIGDAVALESDGRIVVAGTQVAGATETVVVWRLKADGGTPGTAVNGALDPTFDTDGVAGISATHQEQINAIALQSDGKILIAGRAQLAPHPDDAVVWRLKADGGDGLLDHALDTTFDTDGEANFDSGGSDAVNAIAVQGDGKILLAGGSSSGSTGNAVVWRVQPNGGTGATNGALDTAFGAGGVATMNAGGFADGNGLALQPDGKILVAGFNVVTPNPSTGEVWRLTAGGQPDPTFGTAGVATVNPPTGASAESLVVAADRRIFGSGATGSENLLAFRLLGDPFTLSVARAGSGAGSVQSAPGGVDCGGTCTGKFDDASAVTLTAAPAAGSTFGGWSGAGCSGTAPCTVTMSADQAVTASFAGSPPATTTTTTTTPPPKKHFVLKSSRLRMKSFKHSVHRASATVSGLPSGAKVSAVLLAGHTTLARVRATAGKSGRVTLKFTFSKSGRKHLHPARLKTVTLTVTVTPKGDRSSHASLHVKLKRG